MFDLLDRGLLLRVLADPTLIRQEIEIRRLHNCVGCIDEAQLLIEKRRIRS